MYYEAQLDDCDPDKNFVMVGGTNGATHLYQDIIASFRSQGYCTLNFDHRAHGRSEDSPSTLSAELLGEDAAAIIRHVFGGRKVHLLGWSLGGAVSYYLGIEHPDIVGTITLSGMTSCFGKVAADGSCDLGFDHLKWFFSRDLMLRLLGTELQGAAASAAIKMHDTDATMHFFRSLRTGTMTKTPTTWGEWRKEHYHEEIRKIAAPCLLIAGEHESEIGFDRATMDEDVKRLQRAEPPVILEGMSHFFWFEEFNGQKGHDLALGAINAFHAKYTA
jgi:pimeloyl-ACP methyl ester carboxylesterase